MARRAAKKKQKEKLDIRQLINRILDDAMRTRKGFTPEQLASFEETATQARESRRERPIEELTPARALDRMVVRRRAREEVELHPHMTKEAIKAAVKLAEMIEAGKLEARDLKKWVVG